MTHQARIVMILDEQYNAVSTAVLAEMMGLAKTYTASILRKAEAEGQVICVNKGSRGSARTPYYWVRA